MNLSKVSRRFLAFSVLVLFLVVALAPVGVVVAGPGSDPDPIPGTPPDGTSSPVTGLDVTLTILGFIVDVGAAVVL